LLFSHKEIGFVMKFGKIAALFLFFVLAMSGAAFAQPEGDAAAGVVAGLSLTTIGVGLVVIGAAYGISKLASAALEGMARQPEVAGSMQTAMIIAAALIEGFTFFALFIIWRP